MVAFQNDHIIVITSVPPKMVRITGGVDIGSQYQIDCIRSWKGLSSRVISVNPTSEAEAVIAAHPELIIEQMDGSKHELLTRPLVALNELLDVALGTDADVVVLTNADILLHDAAGLAERVGAIEKGHAIVGQRMDIETPESSDGPVCTVGFDLFALHQSDLETLRSNTPLFVGAPWWDYHMITQMLLNGIDVEVLDPNHVRHVTHSGGWDLALWNALGVGFGRDLLKRIRRDKGKHGTANATRLAAVLRAFERNVHRRQRPAYKAVVRQLIGQDPGVLEADDLQHFAKVLMDIVKDELAIIER